MGSHAAHLAGALVVPVVQARDGLGRETPGFAAVEPHGEYAALEHLALEPLG